VSSGTSRALSVLVPARPDLAASLACARAAGLRYINDAEPGFTRARPGGRVVYRDAGGRVVRHSRILDRIRSLAIPPAWTHVWICVHANGHLQATGRDARGRKQYRYHPDWTAERDRGKYDRMIEFGLALPAVRRRVAADMKKAPFSRPFMLGTVVKLLEKTLIRIGNREYAQANKSFGLTTLRDEHVQVTGSCVRFHFRAKSGVMQHVELNDAALARILKRCRELPGQPLFQCVDGDGRRQGIDAHDVNAYLRGITGRPFTAKNFRTWAGTVLAATGLSGLRPPTSEAAFKRSVVQVVDAVRAKLGNTRAVCRKCYVHPGVFEAYRAGVTIARRRAPEGAVLALLKREARREAAPAAA
jgi:DNA topoisomerase-1